jgi:prolipoprotein diacylglyceryltransferase
VQGCCHGAPVDARLGIRIWNTHSRVVSLAHLSGQSIHATQVYSIVSNVAIGVLLLRLWQLHAPLWFISGAYLILAGLARFVEESYRGEPQTRLWLGLPMYQHLAVLMVFTGMALTFLGGAPAPPPATLFDSTLLTAALATGAVYWFAMGVDFPDSRRRFARLSG